jgi:MerR family transcriptional regulator, repressor of the yfmOP operon
MATRTTRGGLQAATDHSVGAVEYTGTVDTAVEKDCGISISDAAASAGVSPRTLRYYEELGLLSPSLHTRGGQRRYTQDDLTQLDRILELREVLGMNLDEIREFLSFETRLDQLRTKFRATKASTSEAARAEQKATLLEALELNESLAEQLNAKLARMDSFRAKVAGDAQRCRELLATFK